MPMIEVQVDFRIGDTVYLRAAREKLAGMVTDIIVNPTGVLYGVTWGDRQDTRHYGIELSVEYVLDFED